MEDILTYWRDGQNYSYPLKEDDEIDYEIEEDDLTDD